MTETKWERAIRFVLAYEGGWVDNTSDRGGETFRGIARNFHGDWAGWAVVDSMKAAPDFPANVNFDPALKGLVVEFYRAHFWNPIAGDELPEKTAIIIFDMAVNSGVKVAARTLQSLLAVECDGYIGPQTIKTAHSREESIIHWLIYAREDFYLDLMKRKPDQRVWAVNWFTRLQELRQEVFGFGPPPLVVG